MPFHESLGFDDHQRIAPTEEASQRHHHEPNHRRRSAWFRFSLLEEGQLLTKKKILSDQSEAGKEQQAKESEQKQFYDATCVCSSHVHGYRSSDLPPLATGRS